MLRELELRRVALPLVEPFVAAHGTVTARDVLVVRAVTDEGEGWAECVAPVDPTYTSEHVEGAHALLRRWAFDLDRVKGHPMAKAAVEGAVLDAALRAAGTSLRDHLGATRESVPAGVAIGLTGDVDALLAAVARRVDEGYRRVKLKISPGWDVEPVAAVRAAFPDLALQVDANGTYTRDTAAALAPLDDHALLLVEQPLAEDDLFGHAELAATMATPICLDESVTSALVAEQAILLGACRAVNVKPGRVGGLREAVAVHDVCRAHGVDAWVGGMLETGLGRAVNLALAALPGFTLPGDLAASSRYFDTDLTEPFVLSGDGTMRVPGGPGIGVTPLPDVLAERTTCVERLSPTP